MKASKTKERAEPNSCFSVFALFLPRVWLVFTKRTDKGAKVSTLTSESTNHARRCSDSSSSSTAAGRRRERKRFINVCKAFIRRSPLCEQALLQKRGKMQSAPRATSLDFLGFLRAAEREKYPLQTALAVAGGKKREGCLLMSCSSKSLRRLSL